MISGSHFKLRFDLQTFSDKIKEVVGFPSTDSQLTGPILPLASLYFLKSTAKDSNFTVDGVSQNLKLLGIVQNLNPLGVWVITN